MTSELPHTFSSPYETHRTRLLIDTIVSFSADCKNILYESLFIDLNIDKMSAMLFQQLDATKAFVLTKDSTQQDQSEDGVDTKDNNKDDELDIA